MNSVVSTEVETINNKVTPSEDNLTSKLKPDEASMGKVSDAETCEFPQSPIPTDLPMEERCSMYEKGTEQLKLKKYGLAVKYFLTALRGLKEDVNFPYLPHCLRDISTAYKELGDYDKALQFIQAEKFYFETALLNSTAVTEAMENQSDNTANVSERQEELRQADDLERLARLCLQKQDPVLALQYCGRATKIRQDCLGNDHPETTASLDFFTLLYAEAGKEQYKDTLKQYEADSETKLKEGVENIADSTESNVRQRGSKKVRFDEVASSAENLVTSAPLPAEREPENAQPTQRTDFALWFTIALLGMALIVCLNVTYCSLATDTPACQSLRAEVHYWYMRMRILYRNWESTHAGTV